MEGVDPLVLELKGMVDDVRKTADMVKRKLEALESELKDRPDTGRQSREWQYALGWFTYHAGQRLTAFHFFLIMTGVVVVGYGQALKDGLAWFALLLSAFGALITFAFWLLEIRNEELVNVGREALDALEAGRPMPRIREWDKDRRALWSSMGWLSRKLFGRFLPEKGNETKRRSITLKLLKHGFWLRTIHLTTFLGFCVGSIYAALGFAWKWPW